MGCEIGFGAIGKLDVNLPLTISSAVAVASLAVMIIGQSPATPVPLPKPRPFPLPPGPPVETVLALRWPVPVETVRYVADPVSAQPVMAVPVARAIADPVPAKARRRERVLLAFDDAICRGKGHYLTRGGKSWRCRR